MKSGALELGMVIKHHEWVEGTEIGEWRLELGWDLTDIQALRRERGHEYVLPTYNFHPAL